MDIEKRTNLEDLNDEYREMAEIIGIENLLALSERFGGSQFYIPQKDKLLKNTTYKIIINEFDGTNIKKLSRKYGVSESTIYRIVRGQVVKRGCNT